MAPEHRARLVLEEALAPLLEVPGSTAPKPSRLDGLGSVQGSVPMPRTLGVCQGLWGGSLPLLPSPVLNKP